MNSTKYEVAGFETPAPIVAMGARALSVNASPERGLVSLDITRTGTKNLASADRAILAKGFHCIRAARKDERNGFPYTAAMEWRDAAELFAQNTRAVEYCWREWERIMQLPRRLAGPVISQPRPENRGCRFIVKGLNGRRQRKSAYISRGRKVHAVRSHGHSDCYGAILKVGPNGVICTALATHKGEKNFESKDLSTHKVN